MCQCEQFTCNMKIIITIIIKRTTKTFVNVHIYDEFQREEMDFEEKGGVAVLHVLSISIYIHRHLTVYIMKKKTKHKSLTKP